MLQYSRIMYIIVQTFVFKDGQAVAAEVTTTKKTSKVAKSKPVVAEVCVNVINFNPLGTLHCSWLDC